MEKASEVWDADLWLEVNRTTEVRPSTGQAARMFSMNLPNWRHDPYVEATYPPGKLQRLATELDGLMDLPVLRRRGGSSGKFGRLLCVAIRRPKLSRRLYIGRLHET